MESPLSRYRLIITGPGLLRLIPRNWRTFVRHCTEDDADAAVALLGLWGVEARVEISD